MKIDHLIEIKLRSFFDNPKIIFDKSRFAGGLTNDNYIHEINGSKYIVRKPGLMTDKMIDRKIEKVNNEIASKLGINSECIYFDDLSGIKISVYIENSRNVADIDPCFPKTLELIASLLQKVHSNQTPFPNVFDWTEELKKYEEIINFLNGNLFNDYFDLKKMLMDWIGANVEKLDSYPCHNDTVPENFILDSQGRLYLVDWEYSGMNDPAWDIAAYILESRLTPEAIDHFLYSYYKLAPLPMAIIYKIKGFMVVQDLLWAIWALIRHYSGDDFLDYCSLRYNRFRHNLKEIVRDTCFPLHLMI